MCDETKHRAGNHQSGASAVAKSDIAEYLEAEPAGLAVLRASEQRPLRLGLRRCADDFVRLFSRTALPLA